MNTSKDSELKQIARLRLARVLIDQGKPDDAIKLLADGSPGSFAGRYHEVHGDALVAKKDIPGASPNTTPRGCRRRRRGCRGAGTETCRSWLPTKRPNPDAFIASLESRGVARCCRLQQGQRCRTAGEAG